MRELICTEIRNSKRWQSCVDNGMFTKEQPAPCLEDLPDAELLGYYDYYVLGVTL